MLKPLRDFSAHSPALWAHILRKCPPLPCEIKHRKSAKRNGHTITARPRNLGATWVQNSTRIAHKQDFWRRRPADSTGLWRKRVGVEPTFEAREGLERQL
jgi:hypothetical protein